MNSPFAASGPVLHRCADPIELARAVADAVAQGLNQGLSQAVSDALTAPSARAKLVVSGGKTPVAMWRVLRECGLPWSRVDITLADERWVPADHPDSNGALVAQHLLQGRAAEATWWPLYRPDLWAAQPLAPDAQTCERLQAVFQTAWAPPPDVVVLGMGGDGHTASWFPGQRLPDDPAIWFMAVPMPEAPNVRQPRLSFTPSWLLSARHLIVQLQGADKEAMLARALMPPTGDAAVDAREALACPIRRALWAPGVSAQVYYSP